MGVIRMSLIACSVGKRVIDPGGKSEVIGDGYHAGEAIFFPCVLMCV